MSHEWQHTTDRGTNEYTIESLVNPYTLYPITTRYAYINDPIIKKKLPFMWTITVFQATWKAMPRCANPGYDLHYEINAIGTGCQHTLKVHIINRLIHTVNTHRYRSYVLQRHNINTLFKTSTTKSIRVQTNIENNCHSVYNATKHLHCTNVIITHNHSESSLGVYQIKQYGILQ